MWPIAFPDVHQHVCIAEAREADELLAVRRDRVIFPSKLVIQRLLRLFLCHLDQSHASCEKKNKKIRDDDAFDRQLLPFSYLPYSYSLKEGCVEKNGKGIRRPDNPLSSRSDPPTPTKTVIPSALYLLRRLHQNCLGSSLVTS